jgi:hypothetical protein
MKFGILTPSLRKRVAARTSPARAIQRCGEILRAIQPAANQHQAAERAQDGAVPSRSQAASDAGLSERQRKTALQVANVPQP